MLTAISYQRTEDCSSFSLFCCLQYLFSPNAERSPLNADGEVPVAYSSHK
jgi:hypothetical protein